LALFGDTLTAAITQAMIAEAISVALTLGAYWHLSRPAAAPPAAVEPDSPA
jgi:hypothetical protein